MPLAEMKRGPRAVGFGAPIEQTCGPTSAQRMQHAHARYQEPVWNGDVWTLSTALAGVTAAAANVSPAAAGTGQPLVGIFNPPGSQYNAVIWNAVVASISGTLGAGGFAWNVIGPNAGISAAGGNGAVNNKTLQAGGSTVRTFVNVATAGSVIGVMFRDIGIPAVGASIFDQVDGSIIVPPGGFAGIYVGAVGTTWVVSASMTWEEVLCQQG